MKNKLLLRLLALSCFFVVNVSRCEIPMDVTSSTTCKRLLEAPAAQFLFHYYDMLGVDGRMSATDAPMTWLLKEIAVIESEGRKVEIYSLVTEDQVLARAIGVPNISRDKVEFKVFIGDSRLGQSNRNLAWAKLVSQVFSYKKKSEFDDAKSDLLAGKISIDVYVNRMSKLYFAFAKESNNFFKDKWEPWCHEKGVLPPSPVPWFGSFNLESFESWGKVQKQLGNLDVWRGNAERILKAGK